MLEQQRRDDPGRPMRMIAGDAIDTVKELEDENARLRAALSRLAEVVETADEDHYYEAIGAAREALECKP
jgi:hypothetical protein